MYNHIVSEDSFTVVKMEKLIDKWKILDTHVQIES